MSKVIKFKWMAKCLLWFYAGIMNVEVVQAQLPHVIIKDISGQSVSTDTLSNGGKPFVIDFFATWCKPCNRELDAISEVYEDWQQETGVKIIAVSIDQAHNINKVKPLVDNHGWEYEVLLDPNSDFRRALGIQMIPYVIICDGQGKIVYRHQGYTDGDETELIEKVRELVGL
jgi:peroxiredoxin